jgi:glucosamine--fructose-6-phosphate aminotransferase (isomerizing)
MEQMHPPNNTAGSRYLADWYGQPQSLIVSAQALDRQWPLLLAAAEQLRSCAPLLLTGMGSSFNAMLALEAFLAGQGIFAKAVDSAELLYYQPLPPQAGVVVASRSGESVEIVKLAEKCRRQGIFLTAVTNSPQSSLGHAANSVIDLGTDFDHLVSLRMYTAIVQGVLALGLALADAKARFPLEMLAAAWQEVAGGADQWRSQLAASGFFGPGHVYYCLGREGSWASANEARVKLEEGGKTAATALLTSAFRHGPQEVIQPQFHAALWLPIHRELRAYDLTLAQNIQAAGAQCLLIGQHLQGDNFPAPAIELPPIPTPFQPVIDVVPMQIGAYLHAMATGTDPDEFRYCSYVVTTEGGL